MGTGLRQAVLIGGPMDGDEGQVVAMPLPDELHMGNSGGFLYRMAGVKDGRVQYRYDSAASRRILADMGMDPTLVALADDSHHGRMLAMGVEPEVPLDGAHFAVEARKMAAADGKPARWECHVNGVLAEVQPAGAFGPEGDYDKAAVQQWVESVVHALATEASK